MTELMRVRFPHANEAAPAFGASVKKAFSSQSTLLGQGEHCSLDPDRLVSLALMPGSQIRVRRNPRQLALYTISETRLEMVDTTVRMALPARQRLGTTEEFDAMIDTQVPHPTFSDDDARAHSEFVERLNDNGCQQQLVVLAPHGGMIEPHTAQQAERVASLLGGDHASVWRCKGYAAEGGAFERWHITSTDIHEASFPLLKTIRSRGFAHAVAFHGFSEADVLIGGAASRTLKEEIGAALEVALVGSHIRVRIAERSENYDGDSAKNIVNRLTVGGANGVQIEQPLEARQGFWQAIADAVALVYRKKLRRAGYHNDNSIRHGSALAGQSWPV
jgi:phage replication-related protein YjqB (UPF0714/DUF867 family)